LFYALLERVCGARRPGPPLAVKQTFQKFNQPAGIVIGEDRVAEAPLEPGDVVADDHRSTRQRVIDPIRDEAVLSHVVPVVAEDDLG
jgi:hypothetical protein